MKSIIRISFLAALLFVYSQTAAQNISAVTTASIPNVNVGLQTYGSGYYQSFSYYNNPEIRRLENEVDRHGNLYRWDHRGNNKYSATSYQNLTEREKKDFRNSAKSFYRSYSFNSDSNSDEKNNKTLEQQAEEYFTKMIAPFLNSDGSVNKTKLHAEIKKDLVTLFEMKETEKQKEVTKLENQLRSLQSTLADRKKNKQEIIDQKMNDVVGIPNTLRW